MENQGSRTSTTRREFLKTTAVAGTALAVNLGGLANVHAAGSDAIKIGLVGCGGRGREPPTTPCMPHPT